MLHVDKTNVGPSLIITVGKHSGGDLWIHKRGKVKVHNVFAHFDGNDAHCTCPFEGERFCLVFYTTSGYEKATPDDRQKLLNVGVPLPEPGEPGLQRKEYPPPAERLEEAIRELPQDLSDCVIDHVVADGGDEEGKPNSEDEGEASDVEAVEPQNEDFRSGQGAQESRGANDKPLGDDDLDEVLRRSLEEYNESQKESVEFKKALWLSEADADIVTVDDSQEVGARASSSGRHPGVAASCMDSPKLQQLCQISQCNRARAEKALADACGDLTQAVLLLTANN
eukprot:gnl/TRDRNA2_/TRDRNA2_174670_c5_seq1.p1 gnl/TRDRNA2_/TRDRNA2_174670_c5~~gnl/TRDRNA2_/TRDRNA2_174670_c5_seq1.p1  ORF type:complete len:282 (-),score=62.87 gnl/TRDRNA2_/TRDRNA2_174670_c5_seq1:45-890(-)